MRAMTGDGPWGERTERPIQGERIIGIEMVGDILVIKS